MAKDSDTVEVPASLLADLKAQVEGLRAEVRLAQEKTESVHAKQVYDQAWERKVAEAGKTPAQRTQEASDRAYGKKGQRFDVWLDSTTEDGRPGPNVSDWPRVAVSANSPEEAGARWLKLVGIRSHRHTLRAEPAA